jgi:hypothetical protein
MSIELEAIKSGDRPGDPPVGQLRVRFMEQGRRSFWRNLPGSKLGGFFEQFSITDSEEMSG